ncbi:rho gtpase-activating protein 68f [Anaeramoeba flamelloides]|uniref:Rho gtpase-activating protein 68f n=1 Tax=Anaeramoeba flamelloides TaxID=1746091 RepID=A0ABQ8YBI2_9EUKA|nr:rho gtpase-activating protein 68f [Anaeramoeba flamelloides]
MSGRKKTLTRVSSKLDLVQTSEILESCLAYLGKLTHKTHYLFTQKTQAKTLISLKNKVNQGKNLHLDRVGSKIISDFILYYFVELREPFIPNEKVKNFLKINNQTKKEEVKRFIKTLPESNQKLFLATIKFCFKMVTSSKFSLRKISKLFAPLFIDPKNKSVGKSKLKILKKLIDFYPFLCDSQEASSSSSYSSSSSSSYSSSSSSYSGSRSRSSSYSSSTSYSSSSSSSSSYSDPRKSKKSKNSKKNKRRSKKSRKPKKTNKKTTKNKYSSPQTNKKKLRSRRNTHYNGNYQRSHSVLYKKPERRSSLNIKSTQKDRFKETAIRTSSLDKKSTPRRVPSFNNRSSKSKTKTKTKTKTKPKRSSSLQTEQKQKKITNLITSNSIRSEEATKQEIEEAIEILTKKIEKMNKVCKNRRNEFFQEKKTLNTEFDNKRTLQKELIDKIEQLELQDTSLIRKIKNSKKKKKQLHSSIKETSKYLTEKKSNYTEKEKECNEIEKEMNDKKEQYSKEYDIYEKIIANFERKYDWQKLYIRQIECGRDQTAFRCKHLINLSKTLKKKIEDKKEEKMKKKYDENDKTDLKSDNEKEKIQQQLLDIQKKIKKTNKETEEEKKQFNVILKNYEKEKELFELNKKKLYTNKESMNNELENLIQNQEELLKEKDKYEEEFSINEKKKLQVKKKIGKAQELIKNQQNELAILTKAIQKLQNN